MSIKLKLGSQGEDVDRYSRAMLKRFKSYALEPDGVTPLRVDGFFGNSEASVHRQWQARTQHPITGEVTDEEFDLIVGSTLRQVARRKIWLYSAPGSGADFNIGPSWELGEWTRNVLNLNHQPVGFPKGGYMGLMGGDPRLSYNEVIAAEGAELERLIDTCPDLRDPDVEFWFSGYSQSADGMKVAVARLFDDGGKYGPGGESGVNLRSRINGLILYGDPTRAPGPTKVGNHPPGWGIARKKFPDWLNDLTWSITTETPTKPDMYACTEDATLLPLFYEWFVKAETELPFIVYSAQIILPAVVSFIPFFGPLAGPLAPMLLATAAGAPAATNVFSTVLQGVNNAAQPPNPQLVSALTAQGLLSNPGRLIATLMALPGIQTHGEYHLPKQEFGGRTGIQVACDIVKDFRRPPPVEV